ncbi:hypothetical protein [Micromonospora chersina]|uniref:hypothetical protein n=1 Tax=Micromonospora chersina TaxID=47854 RepID=UPI003D8CA4DF
MQVQQMSGQVTRDCGSGVLSRQGEVLLSRGSQRLIGDLGGVHGPMPAQIRHQLLATGGADLLGRLIARAAGHAG